jgi:D-alanine-D-alanine ligase
MKTLRVLVLLHETLVPPEDARGYSMQEMDEWRTEYDVTTALKAMGHEVRVLGMGDNLAELRSVIADWKPDITFNLLEEFQGIVTYDQYVVAFLELMRQPYTGCNPRGMMISRDKALSKQILAYHRIPTARFALLPRNRRYREPSRLKFPLFVKSATEDASLGISQASIVHDGQKLRERVQFIHEQTNSDALVEEYIEGREIYVGVLGNEKPEALPLVELDLSCIPEGTPRIAGTEVKWDKGTEIYEGTKPFYPEDLDEATVKRLQETAVAAFQALRLRDYGRIDMRLAADGTAHVLEVNPNCWLSQKAEFAMAAKQAGRSYEALIHEIAELAMARYGAGNGG